MVDDGPTSPEDLKALTEASEPPPVPAGAGGMVAGDGQAPLVRRGRGLRRLSLTSLADPNAPLINPGVLLRGAR